MRITKRQLKRIIREVTEVMNESDRFYGIIPRELWELSDYEDYRDSGIDLRQYSDEELQMKIEQLLEEIEEEKEYMDDPQNQYDTAIAPKESLIQVIRSILDGMPIAENRIRSAVRTVLFESQPSIYDFIDYHKEYATRAFPKKAREIFAQRGGKEYFKYGVQAYMDGYPVDVPMAPSSRAGGKYAPVIDGDDRFDPEMQKRWASYWTAGWEDAAALDADGLDPEAFGEKKKKKKKSGKKGKKSKMRFTEDQLEQAEIEGGEDWEAGRSKKEVPKEYKGTALEDAWLDGWRAMKNSH